MKRTKRNKGEKLKKLNKRTRYIAVGNIPVVLVKDKGRQYCRVLGKSFKYTGKIQYYHLLQAFKLGPKFLKTIEDYTSHGLIKFEECEHDIDSHKVTDGILHLMHFLHKEGWRTHKLRFRKDYQDHNLILKKNEHCIVAYIKDRVKGKIKIHSLPFQSSLNTATLIQHRKKQP